MAILRPSKMQLANMSLIGRIIPSYNNQARENHRFVCSNTESVTFLLLNFIFLFPYLSFKINDLVPELAVLARQFLATKTLGCLTGNILRELPLRNKLHIIYDLIYIFLFAQSAML